MAEARDAILTGVKAALSLHRDLGVREPLERTGGGRIDVFEAISKLGAALIFQPLDKLLGAYVPADEPGILVTTRRSLPIQRFTAAHELGHFTLRHQPSLDDQNILRRAPFNANSRVSRQEREADAFASMFLAPAWLIALIVQRQGWLPERLLHPSTVYQLSLRLGTSYSATCHVLERHKVLTRSQRERIAAIEPKEIKRALLGGYEPLDWRSDVWLLTARDEGVLVEGGKNDLFVVRLNENSSAGYLWNFDELKAAGFGLVADSQDADSERVGGLLTRTVTAQSSGRVSRDVTLLEQRPWMPEKALQQLHIRCELRGPEEPGMWEAELARALQAA